jgi:light-regulated signal transduction histidine kinase (bacteriophytochrome)
MQNIVPPDVPVQDENTVAESATTETVASLQQRIERLEARTAQLEAANRELEAFNYLVSHDLRVPLRAVKGFARVLQEKHRDRLPPDAQNYLDVVQENAGQMDVLLDALLDFSRWSLSPLNKQAVDSKQMVQEVLEMLRPEFSDRTVEITVGELPPCVADPLLLRQVWLNLLSNALKYTQQREVARLEISGRQAASGECGSGQAQTIYHVRDNGCGFDMRHATRLFQVFQRLHEGGEFEGTGVGLAIVENLVRRHGGRVWATGSLGEGATFTFCL